MPGLTVTEKQHWKERISRRIDKRIEAIFAADPAYQEKIQRQARDRALESLGLDQFQAELCAIDEQSKTLETRERQIQRAMVAKVRGVTLDDISEGVYGRFAQPEIQRAMQRRQESHEEELLAESEQGRQILQLRKERENLLDTVWLATSGTQLKQLWTKVSELLVEQPTQLERDALAIKPDDQA
jgi:hypothetical protein